MKTMTPATTTKTNEKSHTHISFQSLSLSMGNRCECVRGPNQCDVALHFSQILLQYIVYVLNKLTKSVACYLLGCFHSSLWTCELFRIGIATAAAVATAATAPPVNQCLLHTHTDTHKHLVLLSKLQRQLASGIKQQSRERTVQRAGDWASEWVSVWVLGNTSSVYNNFSRF